MKNSLLKQRLWVFFKTPAHLVEKVMEVEIQLTKGAIGPSPPRYVEVDNHLHRGVQGWKAPPSHTSTRWLNPHKGKGVEGIATLTFLSSLVV